MAKDDYHVIVYKILAYLYCQLKVGENVEKEMISYDGVLFNINYKYWIYILRNLLENGYITGITLSGSGGGGDAYRCPHGLEQCQITPKGIDYLCENSTLHRAVKFLKDFKEITPFI